MHIVWIGFWFRRRVVVSTSHAACGLPGLSRLRREEHPRSFFVVAPPMCSNSQQNLPGAAPKKASAVIPACNFGRKAQRSRLPYPRWSSAVALAVVRRAFPLSCARIRFSARMGNDAASAHFDASITRQLRDFNCCLFGGLPPGRLHCRLGPKVRQKCPLKPFDGLARHPRGPCSMFEATHARRSAICAP